MKKKTISKIMLIAFTFVSSVHMMPIKTYAKENQKDIGTIYYVSSKNGNDSNSGTSERTPFKSLDMINDITLKPGDKVLLEKGSVFDDQYMHIKGSGNENNVITISSYGKGDKPQINTNGAGVWYQDYGKSLDNPGHKYKGNVSSAILLNDVEYIEISDLEITNDRESGIDDADKGLKYNDINVMDRTGVAGITKNIGTANHIVLDNLYIHDVDGNVYNKHMLNGGIYFIAGIPDNEAQTGISKYDDLQIKNCNVDTVNRWGIAAAYTAYWDYFSASEINDEAIKKYGATNVLIENNYIKDAGGDSITTMYCDRPLVQNNISEGAARQINPTDYSATGFGRVAAAVWPWKCKDAIFQYNEVFDTCANQDGQAWDADSGDGTLYQYNYSHNNGGGAVMFCAGQAINNTFRYNISQNDLSGVINPAGNPDAHIYNNVFYMKKGVSFIRQGMSGGFMTIENNIIYNSDENTVNENWYKETNENKVKYDNNIYYNYDNTPINDTNAISVSKETQIFERPGTAPKSTTGIINNRESFEGYKLAENSPAINAGKIIKDANGKDIVEDFFGRKISAIPEIGVSESDKVSIEIRSNVYNIENNNISNFGKNTTVKEFLSDLIYDEGLKIVVKDKSGNLLKEDDVIAGGMTVETSYGNDSLTYQLVSNSDNQLKETSFMIKDKTIYVPSTEKNPITIGELKGDIKVHETAAISIWNDNSEVKSGPIEEGMILRISAENGNKNDYEISIKNNYQWALDYAGPKQGNVWFGQIRKSESEYENLTNYDAEYPNWAVDTYFGPGVDLQNHQTPTDENTHGLLSDTTGSSKAEGMAMAFRAPKSGVVAFNIKDEEPYLRQSPNSDGKVILKLTVNGETLQSCELSESKVKGDFPAVDSIVVKKGDYIRVEAKNEGKPTKPSVHITPQISYLNIAIEDTESPTKPVEVTVAEITENSAVLSWKESYDNVELAGYNIYVNGELINKEELIKETSYKLDNLEEGQEYGVEIKAVDASGNESEASSVSFETNIFQDTELPTKPGEITVAEITENSAVLSWGESYDNTKVIGYNLYLNGRFITMVTDLTYTIEGLEAAKSYNFEVSAIDSEGNESDKAKISFTTKKAEVVPSPTPSLDKEDKVNGENRVETGDETKLFTLGILILGAAGIIITTFKRKKEYLK